MIDSILKQKPMLIKNGEELPLKIISSEVFSGTQTLKNSIKKTIGDNDSFEFIGIGDRKIKVPVYLDSQEEYDNLFNFISDGSSLLLVCTFFPLVPVNIEGDIILKPYYAGYGMVDLNFTTAVSPYQDIDALLNYIPQISGIGDGSKKSVLDRLRDYGQNTFDFVSNTNEKVGGFTNTVSAFAAALNNQAQGIASASTIITNPISSIRSSLSQVIGGISGVVTAMQNTVAAIQRIPSDVDQLIETFLQIGDQLNDLFDLGDSNATLKYNTELLSVCAAGIISADLSSDNKDIATFDAKYLAPQYFLTVIQKDNNSGSYVLILTSILLNLYENAENINKWNTKDLDNLRITTENIYQFIITFELSSDLRLQLDLARNNFFRLFKELYDRALKVITVNLPETKFLTDVVYSVNGNYDYYEDTKLLNNIVGTRVIGDIFVIRND